MRTMARVETEAVPGGTFRMGSLAGRPDEQPVFSVTLRAFRLGRTPVTNAQYRGFVEATGAVPPPFWCEADFAEPDLPVVGVTWFEAAAYAAWLEATEGGSWRLPTEAEWERAMRGGLEDACTAWGDGLPKGEIPEGPLAGPWAVGLGRPNGFGLLDPGTVVHEWCADPYGPYGREAPSVREEDALSVRRSSRGGSWRHRQRWSPPSARSSLLPGLRYADYGFRVLREEA